MTPRLYASPARRNERLNQAKKRSSGPKPVAWPWAFAFSSSAERAGERVSELIAEITVEMAIVSANWR